MARVKIRRCIVTFGLCTVVHAWVFTAKHLDASIPVPAAQLRSGYYYSVADQVVWLFGLDPVRHTGAMLDPRGSVHHLAAVEGEPNGGVSFEARYPKGPLRFVGHESDGTITGVFGVGASQSPTRLKLAWIAPVEGPPEGRSRTGGFYSNKFVEEDEPGGFDLLIVPRLHGAPVGFFVVYEGGRGPSWPLGSATLVGDRLRFRIGPAGPSVPSWIVSGTIGRTRAVLRCQSADPAAAGDCFAIYGYRSGTLVLPKKKSLWQLLPIAAR